ncbi:hypothetical protein [Novosphingobium album (ex Liu et al. 2023)]|uniref:Sulfotransferase domain-containing protein n=1 Tax=Novosphingobium album (ex Liu et al. 2023) TaxID=3031130 RepID=A0ABT5WQU5_9SPHN|nr:hypothetical protein [Novosphingobium album (ex Liu et al. 2023)]MDE8652417.1 hypothetical protein [Novosphingobium album (ex Liu et al. 2023)]
MTEKTVFVTGIWKSGNHLVYSALNTLGIEGPFNGIAANLLFGRGAAAKRLLRGSASGIDVGLETEARVRPGYIHHSLRKLRGKIVGGHAAFSPELLALLRAQSVHMIVIRRDPRDILVSFADWIDGRPDYFMYPDFAGLSREQKVARLIRGGAGSGYTLRPFSEVLTRAEGWRTAGKDVLSVSFEDLIGPKGDGTAERQAATVAAICRHLGRPVPDDPELIERIYGGSLTFNKGRTQRWRELQGADLRNEITACLAPHLARWDYDLEPPESADTDGGAARGKA